MSSVLWRCDGMKDTHRTTLDRPRAWWNVTYTVKKLGIKESGRLHLASWNVNVTSAPRALAVRDRDFVDASGKVVLLEGTNVVMKAAPWIPDVTGDSICADRWFSNFTCYSFSHADATHVTKTMGWNFVRLGVVWAGGQPTATPSLDPEWLARLDAFMELCRAHGIYVVLDVPALASLDSTTFKIALRTRFLPRCQPPGELTRSRAALAGAPGRDRHRDMRRGRAAMDLRAGDPLADREAAEAAARRGEPVQAWAGRPVRRAQRHSVVGAARGLSGLQLAQSVLPPIQRRRLVMGAE